MLNCQTCQSQLLHHLYGVLDDAETQALTSHLGDCPACQAAMAKAHQQQQMLAAAAKTEFPNIRFDPLAASKKQAARPPVQRPRRIAFTRRFAIAASILLVVGGASLFTGYTWLSNSIAASHARTELASLNSDLQKLMNNHQSEQNTIQTDIAQIQKQIEAVEAHYRDQLIQIKREYDTKPVEFTVLHSKTLQAGGLNHLTIEAKRKPGVVKGPDYQLIAMVVDEKTKKELARLILRDGANDFVLPADLPLKPGTRLNLRVVGAQPGKADETLIDETLPLVTSLFVTHLTTDRPMYRPGEVVHFRSLTLERFSLKPADEEFGLQFRFVKSMGGQEQKVAVIDHETGQPAKLLGGTRLKNPDGTPLLGPGGKELRGIGAGAFRLPAELPGGEYTLIVSETYDRFPAESRKIIVNRYQAPRLYKDVDFTRKSYGPGDTVTATCKVSPVEGGRVLANLPVLPTASVDGAPCELLTKGPLVTDDRGQCIVQFKLPAKIDRGEGILSVTFSDGGNVETTVEPIPIVLKKLKVEFFPEGGELIAGTLNRVYFQVRTPLLKPAELRGRIVNQDGKEIVAIHTVNDDKEIGVNQGMGRFEFTPAAGQRYELKIDAPEGIEGEFQLPPVQTSGVALHLPLGVVTEKIDVELYSAGKTRKLLVGAYCRGQLLDHQTVTVQAGKSSTVTLKPSAAVAGVYRVTVFEKDDDDATLKPVAERLLYRRSPEKLNLKIFTDKKTYTPGDRVTLSLSATDQHDKPAPAIVLISVVDKSILKLRNDRTARAMPTHFLLTSEVRGPEDLEYADFLLLEESRDGNGGDVAKAQVALDLLLGTQGWRRFVEQKSPGELKQVQAIYKDDTARLLTVSGQGPQQQIKETLIAPSASKAAMETARKHEILQRELGAKEAKQEKVLSTALTEAKRIEGQIANNHSTIHAAESRLKQLGETVAKFAVPGAIVLALLLAILLIVSGVVRAYRQQPTGGIVRVAGVLCLLVMVIGGSIWLADSQRLDDLQFAAGTRLMEGTVDLGMKRAGLPQDENIVLQPVPDEPVAGKNADKAALRQDDMKKDERLVAPNANTQLWKAKAPLPAVQGGAKKGIAGGGLLGGGPGKGGPVPVPTAGLRPGELPIQIFDNANAMQKGDMKKADEGRTAFGGEDKAALQLGVFLPDPLVAKEPPQAEWDGLNMFRFGKIPEAEKLIKFVQGRKLVEEPLRQLRKAGEFAAITKGQLALQEQQLGIALPKDKAALVIADAFIVREYAHQHPSNPDNVRRDFAETVYWHPALVIPGDKSLDVRFELCDAVTQFEVKVWGHTQDGRLGDITKDIAVRLPFSLDAKLPIEISSTDKLAIPVTLSNDTEKNRDIKLSIEADNLKFLDKADQMLPLPANSRIRKMLHFQPSIVQGEAKLRLFGLSEPFGMDSIERAFKIVSDGFPIADKQSGTLEGNAVHHIKLPAKRTDWVPSTLKLQVQAYPSSLADLQKGLEALLREPGGCFEQTSSSNYPNIMILDYLKESNQLQPELEKKARAMLERGYGRLIVYECIDPVTNTKKQGYEWFGNTAPPHEALTAYGLLQFLDMAKYQPVDQAMIERTKNYLLGQRDGKGGFLRNSRALDKFGHAPEEITNAYIVWALCEADVREDISRELDAVVANANRLEDPYILSLASLSLIKRGQPAKAMPLLKKLNKKQKDDGSLAAARTSITNSGGAQLAIETTSLAVLAWLRANQPGDFGNNVRKATDYIGKQRGAFGGYGSTQSTILALKALIAHTRESKKTAEAGELRLLVNGEPITAKAFAAGTVDPITVDLRDEKFLNPDANTIRVEITGKNVFPYTVTWSYMALTPANKDVCPVRLTTSLAAEKAVEGETLRVTAELQNTSGQDQGMAVAIIGLPGGCALPADLQELRNLVKASKIDAFEVRGRELVLYWRGLAKGAKNEVNFSVICQVPGQYRGPASRAYLYYNTDERWWVEPLNVAIVEK